MHRIKHVDICFGLNWGDEAKGKIVSYLARKYKYNYVCRWNGSNNAGHTIYKNGNKYKTHLIPSGIFYDIPSIIGPECVVNKNGFQEEIDYLDSNGFNTDLIKISPKTHIISDDHIIDDIKNYGSQGTTSKGIAPCYRDKYGRTGIQVKDDPFFKKFLWDEKLSGNILCEGAQGFWLDINFGNYPYVTSSVTLPYSACSLGFSPKYIRNIYGASKIYDTRSGTDPDFPEELLENDELKNICYTGQEYGTTTGRLRKVNWLNLDKLIDAINLSGTTHLVISKIDILQKINIFKLIFNNEIKTFNSYNDMASFIEKTINTKCLEKINIVFSGNVETVEGL